MNIKKVIAYLKFSVLLLIIAGIPMYLMYYYGDLIRDMSNFSTMKDFIEQNQGYLYTGGFICQVIQIIICLIPSQWIQFGMAYFGNPAAALIISMTGAFTGTAIAYYIARFLGHDAMHLIFGEEKIQNLIKKINSKHGMMLIFLFYLIPGVPKDLCCYAAGLSEARVKPFLFLSTVGRTPAMLGSILIGTQVRTGNYHIAVIVGVIALILFVLGIKYRHKIDEFLDRKYTESMGDTYEKGNEDKQIISK